MLSIITTIEEIFKNHPITNKKQVLAVLKVKFPELSSQQRKQCTEVTLSLYKEHLEILTKPTGRGY